MHLKDYKVFFLALTCVYYNIYDSYITWFTVCRCLGL